MPFFISSNGVVLLSKPFQQFAQVIVGTHIFGIVGQQGLECFASSVRRYA